MKYAIFYVLILLVNLCINKSYGEYYRDINNNLCNENWWKTATVEQLDSELIKQNWNINEKNVMFLLLQVEMKKSYILLAVILKTAML